MSKISQASSAAASPKTAPKPPEPLARFLYAPALLYFAAVAETLSIRGAARQLNIASSAVNRQILLLEKALGNPLFERRGRSLRLMPMGEVLARHAHTAFRDLEATLADIHALRGLQRGTVRVGCVESIAGDLLPMIVGDFARLYPLINVQITVDSSSAVADLVARGEIEIGFTFNPPKHLSVAFARDLSIGAVMAPDHALAGENRLSLAQCLDHPLALPAKSLSIRVSLDTALAAGGLVPKRFVEANLLRFGIGLALNGGFVTFQLRFGIEPMLRDGSLVFIPLADSTLPVDRFAVVTRSDATLRLAAAVFFDLSRATLARLLPQ